MAGGQSSGGDLAGVSLERATVQGFRRDFHRNGAKVEGILTTLLAKVEGGRRWGHDGGAGGELLRQPRELDSGFKTLRVLRARVEKIAAGLGNVSSRARGPSSRRAACSSSVLKAMAARRCGKSGRGRAEAR